MWSCIADCNDFFFHPFSPELLLYVRTKWLTKIENESYWRHHDGKMCESCMALLQRRNLQKQHAISEVPCQRHFYSATGYCLLHKSNSTQCKRLHAFFFSEQTRCTHLVAPLSDPGVPSIGDMQICPAIAQQEPNVEAAASASHHYRIKRCAPLKPKFFPTAKWSRLV